MGIEPEGEVSEEITRITDFSRGEVKQLEFFPEVAGVRTVVGIETAGLQVQVMTEKLPK